MTIRIVILSLCFLATTAYLASASHTEPVSVRLPLSGFPMQLEKWHGQDAGDFNARVVTMLGVDDYINRAYMKQSETASLYIGFYQSQRQGSAIHSPMNCLPGAGWNPVERSALAIPVASASASQPDRTIKVNRIVIEKGADRQMVLYWYQSHGRVISSEYWGKLYTVLDAIHLNRTDAALIRVITPIDPDSKDAVAAAEHTTVDFVHTMFPVLSSYLPD